MRSKFISLIFCVGIFCAGAFGQPVIKAQKTTGGSADDNFSCMALTADGGLIEGGTSYSGISGNKTDTSRGGSDYWIVKFDKWGNKQWDKTVGGSDDDFLVSIEQTSDSGYVLGGYSYSNGSGEKSENTIGFPDYWIVKLDKNHNIQWDKTFGISDENYYRNIFKSLQQTHDGGYVLAGILSGSDPYTAPFLVVKLDAHGNTQWDTTIGGEGATAVIQQTDDNGYILGCSNYNHGLDETYFKAIKFDRFGHIQWNRDYRVADGYLSYLNAVVQITGGYILGGYSNGDSIGVKSAYCRGGYDYWLLKIDKAGNVLSDKTIGGSGYDYLKSLDKTADEGIILGGYSTSNMSGEKTEDNRGGGGLNDNDYWVVKLDHNGNIQWDKTIGGSANDYMYSIMNIAANKYLLGGYSSSGISGDKMQASKGGSDYWSVILNYYTLHAGASANLFNADAASQKEFTVHPNPAINILHIQLKGKATFILIGQSGKAFAVKTIEHKGTIDISRVPAGIYFLTTAAGVKQAVIIDK